jgi:hypothetical protein
MPRIATLALMLLLLPAAAPAADKKPAAGRDGSEPKTVSGISIVGNDDAPKSLYIVPWKASELGDNTLTPGLLDARTAPVDKDVFMREVRYYELRNPH